MVERKPRRFPWFRRVEAEEKPQERMATSTPPDRDWETMGAA